MNPSPRAASAPPLNRGAMTARPWRGFWPSVGAGLRAVLTLDRAAAPVQAGRRRQPDPSWAAEGRLRRRAFLVLILALTAWATATFIALKPASDALALTLVQSALFALLFAWVASGAITAVMGFWVGVWGDRHALDPRAVRDRPLDPARRTAIVMPICHEDVATVFAGLRATCESLIATGQSRHFDVFVLSDSKDPAILAQEWQAWAALRSALAARAQGAPEIEVYYRARKRRTHRKAGNVADFCRRWGRDYAYMVVLDADSVMSGDCVVTLAQLMEAHPRAGIIQTMSQSIGHATVHARAQQFAARVAGRLFALGMQFWQLGDSHYFGHNAIIRVQPFMAHGALAPIPGTGGLTGSILSHDFVEAALMRRAGYEVWMVSDLKGSYEQQPPDVLSELQRDRRWCQGNLQNLRLMAEPGFSTVHRFMFLTGALSYVSAPLWLLFMGLGMALWGLQGEHTGLAEGGARLGALGLWFWTLFVLVLPRVLGIASILLRKEAVLYGGVAALVRSALLETLLALMQAPLRMLAHSLFVAVALTGWKLEWTSPPRDARVIAWKHAAGTLALPTLLAALLVLSAATLGPSALLWLAPVWGPLLFAIPMAVFTSDQHLGEALRAQHLLRVPEEARAPRVLRRAWSIGSASLQPL
jgi:membrane glycosyltransferase